MKAWRISDKFGEYGTVIVFADTAGKAKQLCLGDDTFDDCDWTDLRARRFKAYDCYYDGKAVVDFWRDAEHRVRLVKDFGWSCMEVIESYCKDCSARHWCSWQGCGE